MLFTTIQRRGRQETSNSSTSTSVPPSWGSRKARSTWVSLQSNANALGSSLRSKGTGLPWNKTTAMLPSASAEAWARRRRRRIVCGNAPPARGSGTTERFPSSGRSENHRTASRKTLGLCSKPSTVPTSETLVGRDMDKPLANIVALPSPLPKNMSSATRTSCRCARHHKARPRPVLRVAVERRGAGKRLHASAQPRVSTISLQSAAPTEPHAASMHRCKLALVSARQLERRLSSSSSTPQHRSLA
mmetsp:Transcript_121685/g.351295  ORF Transcript_121685/g.351295 Transcript_121685/m.351295 type:complete len:246 (+) Transcript_121685:250-987(+)